MTAEGASRGVAPLPFQRYLALARGLGLCGGLSDVRSRELVHVAPSPPFSAPHVMLFLLTLESFSVSAVIAALTFQCQRVALQVACCHEVIRHA